MVRLARRSVPILVWGRFLCHTWTSAELAVKACDLFLSWKICKNLCRRLSKLGAMGRVHYILKETGFELAYNRMLYIQSVMLNAAHI